MALKEDIDAIKQEIGAEEQFLESMIKSERVVKKYKYPLIALAVLVVLVVTGYQVTTMLKEKRIKDSNIAYENLLKNPKNANALKELKDSSPVLYQTYLFMQASKNGDKEELKKVASSNADSLLKDLAKFQLDGTDPTLLKNFSALLSGYKLLQAGKITEAKEAFSKIPLTSPLQEIVKKLNHFQGIKK